MRLIRFKVDEKEHLGVMENHQAISLTDLSPFMKCSIPKTLEELISFSPNISRIEDRLKNLEKDYKMAATYKTENIEILAPLVNPPKIICLGLNYYDHAAELNAKVPDEPIIFMKPRTALTGPNRPIIKPSFVEKLDYEAELAIIIGKRCKKTPVERAKEYIFGYTIFNDVSARGIQFKDGQWTRGKSFDTFAPIGPCITTTNQIANPNNLKIRAWVNEELRQDSSTKNMVFNVYEVIHHLSKVMTLEPADVIATGTPAGVGIFMKPEPKFLKQGDKVVIEIENIGKLENFIVEESK